MIERSESFIIREEMRLKKIWSRTDRRIIVNIIYDKRLIFIIS